jgi:chromosome segregation ATPase
MKTKVVLWGEKANAEKVLLALELLERENKVMLYVFPLEVATEEFYKNMMDNWREGKAFDFPQPHEVIERPLSVSESILPDEIKVERADIISRAQAEWHFVVLSSKLYEMYKTELDEIKEKIDGVTEYDNKLWEEAKNFWTKVQDQAKEQNLFREQTSILKERVNNLFDKLKDLKKTLQGDFDKASKEVADSLMAEIKDVEEKFGKGLGLRPLFDQLKNVQAKYKDAKLTKSDRESVWDKLDGTFKTLKSKTSGGNTAEGESKFKSRYDGLIESIGKMESSVKRDKQDYDFQVKKIETTDGQLEMQIRKAKLTMLEERINSKTEKLNELLKVKVELESKMGKEEARMASEAKKSEAREAVKKKIASDIEAAKEERETLGDILESAANKIASSKKAPSATSAPVTNELKEDSILDAISNSLSDSVEDLIDTAKAVASVVSEKLESLSDEVENKIDAVEDKIENIVENITKEESKEEDKSEDTKA